MNPHDNVDGVLDFILISLKYISESYHSLKGLLELLLKNVYFLLSSNSK